MAKKPRITVERYATLMLKIEVLDRKKHTAGFTPSDSAKLFDLQRLADTYRQVLLKRER